MKQESNPHISNAYIKHRVRRLNDEMEAARLKSKAELEDKAAVLEK